MTLKRVSGNLLRGGLSLLVSAFLISGCGGGYETKTARGEGIREWFLEFDWGRVEAYAVWPPGGGLSSGNTWPAILLLHGADARAQRFRRAMLNHARDGFFLMSVSLPGFGASTGPEDFAGPKSVEAALGAIRYLRTRPNVEKDGVFIYGVGQGASTAALAAARSENISALILENGLYEPEKAYVRLSNKQQARMRTAIGARPREEWRPIERAPPSGRRTKSKLRFCFFTTARRPTRSAAPRLF